MHAALITGKETVELVEVPEPEPMADGAVVDVEMCGICGTDIHAWQSGDPYNPAICGHEWTGVVSAVGDDVRTFSEGDRVVCAVPPACGRCEACIAGQTTWCQSTMLVAVGRDRHAQPHGGFAPRIAAHIGRLVHVNPALSVEQAAQVEPATVGFHAVRHTQPELGDVVVVQGAGPIGLVTLQAALAGGAGEVIVVEPNEARRELASSLGATHVVGLDDAGDLIAERSKGLGADLVYEAVGRSETIQQAVDRCRRGGRVCLIGYPIGPATINPGVWLVKEVKFSAALAYTHDDFERCMGLIADGRMQLDPMHSSTVSVHGLADAIAELASGSSAETKVLVDPRL
ncbi:MAG: zinc-binding dehydrogenase [Actinomycetota bacterium]